MTDTTYDFPVPTVSGQAVTVQWLMADPRRIYRILRTIVQQRLIGDLILTGRVDLTGTGSGIFEISESIFPDQQASLVAPLGEYTETTDTPGALSTVKPGKWGLKTEISDEEIAHNRIDIVVRKLTKLGNRLVFQNDAQTLSAVASAITQVGSTAAVWTGSSAVPFLDVLLADATVDSLNQGYATDTVVVTPTGFAYGISRAAILDYMPREDAQNILQSGKMAQIAGKTWLKTTNMPSGVQGMVLDSTMLGSQAFEALGGGYQGTPGGVESKRIRNEDGDGWKIQARIVKAPMVQEPGAAVKFTSGITS